MDKLLILFLSLRIAKHLLEHFLLVLNRRYFSNKDNQERAKQLLKITDSDMSKSLRYTEDRYRFQVFSSWVNESLLLVFIAVGGFGFFEIFVKQQTTVLFGATMNNEIVIGLGFFALLGIVSMLLQMPFSYYRTFYLEEKHGFNRQTKAGFFTDVLKNILVAVLIGSVVLSVLIWIMLSAGSYWWVYGWLFMFGFALFSVWLYPTVLAPLFNKFTEIVDGELKDGIFKMAAKVGFKTDKIFIMDASKRTSHGNAYFTGIFGGKRIVLFDTLVSAMQPAEVIAVLAHEIGHYKLNHVRWQLVRSFVMTGIVFLLLSVMISQESFYHTFSFTQPSSYAALIVFALWFGLIEFLLQPISSYISRRNEFAADRFAKDNLGGAENLISGLLKLREKSSSMPLCHPIYSSIYYSHPPMIERIVALK